MVRLILLSLSLLGSVIHVAALPADKPSDALPPQEANAHRQRSIDSADGPDLSSGPLSNGSTADNNVLPSSSNNGINADNLKVGFATRKPVPEGDPIIDSSPSLPGSNDTRNNFDDLSGIEPLPGDDPTAKYQVSIDSVSTTWATRATVPGLPGSPLNMGIAIFGRNSSDLDGQGKPGGAPPFIVMGTAPAEPPFIDTRSAVVIAVIDAAGKAAGGLGQVLGVRIVAPSEAQRDDLENAIDTALYRFVPSGTKRKEILRIEKRGEGGDGGFVAEFDGFKLNRAEGAAGGVPQPALNGTLSRARR